MFEKFAENFDKEEKELLVLTKTNAYAGHGNEGYWTVIQKFIAL